MFSVLIGTKSFIKVMVEASPPSHERERGWPVYVELQVLRESRSSENPLRNVTVLEQEREEQPGKEKVST